MAGRGGGRRAAEAARMGARGASFPSGSYGAGDRKAAVECRKATRPALMGAPAEAPIRAKAGTRLVAPSGAPPPRTFCGGKTAQSPAPFGARRRSPTPGDIQCDRPSRASARRTAAQSAPQPDDDDPVPKNIDEFRNAAGAAHPQVHRRPRARLAPLPGGLLPAARAIASRRPVSASICRRGGQ